MLRDTITNPGSETLAHEASDEVLMVRVAEGSVEAYEQLYSRYKNRVLTFIYRYVGDREWAEDLAQEVFLKLYRNPRAFDPRNRFMTWLFAVARNAAIDFLRRKKPITHLSDSTDADNQASFPIPPDTASGPVDMALLTELEDKLQHALDSLSPKLREVFILAAIQGLSYEEIASIVKCPAKTVSSRLARARQRFAHRFGPYLSGSRTSQ